MADFLMEQLCFLSWMLNFILTRHFPHCGMILVGQKVNRDCMFAVQYHIISTSDDLILIVVAELPTIIISMLDIYMYYFILNFLFYFD